MMKTNEFDGIKIINTKDINLFLPLMQEIVELEERFLLAMLRWCGYGRQRYKPLKYWQVFIAVKGEVPLGVTGLYQNSDTPAHIGWLGWFGVRPEYRGHGIGTMMVNFTSQYAASLNMTELWVYTDDTNIEATKFYQNRGFEIVGKAAELFPDDRYELRNIVMKKLVLPSKAKE
ncbi:MAG TPA: GNAT family N-acetyltransferase [Thermodesulfovibrionales bacterium]|nr:GNAT family N-acetyltransferase [Thermodesulfovibrionales bacterium]